MLDEFRSTLITWDKATSRIYSPVTANESDENGRKLVVKIVNSGQVEDLTGATLHLYWETRDKLHDGLDVFKAVDLKKGEFELSYTTGMLSNKGVLNANLVLIDTIGRVVSERFKITVTEGIDNDAIQSENSFTTLTQALIDISNLEKNYAPRLNDLTAQLQQTEQELSSQLAQIEYVGRWLNERLRNQEGMTVTVIGDSITAGVGTSGYNLPSDTPIIFTESDGTVYRESNQTSDNWANNFRNLLQSFNPNLIYKKWGIGGKSAKFFNENKEKMTTNEDIVFIMLGANDRVFSNTPDEFYADLKELVDYFKTISNQVVLMSSNPSGPTSDTGKNFIMQEVNKVIHEVGVDLGVPVISHYDYFFKYCAETKTSFSDLMTDGIHPNSNGSEVMFKNLQSELKLYNQERYLSLDSGKEVIFAKVNEFLANSIPSDFVPEAVTFNLVAGTSNTVGFPGTGTNSGILMTNTVRPENGFVWQEYHLYNKNQHHRRYWTSSAKWSEWESQEVFVSYKGVNAFTEISLITDFPSGRITYTSVTTTNASNFPEGLGGTLMTNNLAVSNDYAYQEYRIVRSNKIYTRPWTTNGWGGWVKVTTG